MKPLSKNNLIYSLVLLLAATGLAPATFAAEPTHNVSYRNVEIDGVNIFYREAGNPANPTFLLLHGFPTSSHMCRNLIPALADQYHLIAPDYPGYGFSAMPTIDEFDYSFDNVAKLMEQFIDVIELENFSMYLMDYGAPIGFRIAANQPERIDALIVQNGNAYIEGIDNDFWEPIQAYWKDRAAVNKGLDNPWWKNIKAAYEQPEMTNDDALRFLLTLGATQWQYTNGVPDVTAVSPDNWGHVQPLLDRDGNTDIQLQMFYSYGSNPPLYPEWQAYLREHQPPTLIVWGKNDEIFPAAGAEPYKRDLQNLEYHLLDTGHFALETHGQEIADLMRDFLQREVQDD
ncbi:MAG: alpha/beta fold hydrolase [Alphaproteobacteria bacterium]